MKWKLLAKTAAVLSTLLGIKEIPINAEKKEVDFTAEELAKIEAVLGKEMTAEAIEGMNSEIKQLQNSNLQLKAIKDELAALVKETNLSEEELRDIAGSEGKEPDLLAQLKLISAKQKEMESTISALIKEPEGDNPLAIVQTSGKGQKVVHSATHLFASNQAYDAFEGRPWNRLASGQTSAATNFADQPTIQKLNDDLGLYFRQNPEAIKSLHRDTFGLPEFWPKKTKVDHKIADATISTAEITQARKLPWLPKNKQKIQAEEGQIFPVQIDIEYVGYYLQKIEASWLNMMNKEGSQPYKESFVRFLVSELDKQARTEDRIASIKGVYVETPEDATVPGRFINRQNGLLYLAQQARDVTKKYRPFDLGLPTAVNIVDYVDNFIKSLPYDVRNQLGLVFYLSEEWLKTYKRRYEQLYGTNTDYQGYPKNPKDYSNISFCPLVDMEGSDFMFLTFNDNIEILENVPAEKSLYHFEYLKRMIYIWADYKLGIRFIHIGNVLEENDPLEFAVQTLWSNTAPVLPADFFVPVHDDESGKVKVSYKNLYVTKGWNTDITELTGTTPGAVIKIKGDTSLSGVKNVKDGAKIDLVGNADFNLKSGGTLTLFVKDDGTVKEVSRTAGPEVIIIPDVTFDEAVIDANEGQKFVYSGTGDIAITNILNGVDGKSIKIFGNATADSDVTLSDTGNINVVSAVTLAKAADFIQLTRIDGVWLETNRLINP
ncbi:MAG: hypothetical protein BGO88_04840 [Flavobacterium sp. 38-13]|uniref:hypothetical protein n=1 Tax=Flavobacterium sp. 38-13 TaxID=1896168 RepID=UPI0009659C62|nr:hypothetical protein [Flavobacterium sp. 38-13]OJX55544.1 MAG: hypothetical protein BGO88_04840 [Flavobacterium sp. 38-13]